MTSPKSSSSSLNISVLNESTPPHLIKLCIIGQGSFGTIYKVRNTLTQTIQAIKTFPLSTKYKSRELQILSSLPAHPNVISLLSYFYSKKPSHTSFPLYLNLIFPYYPDTLSRIIIHNYNTQKSFTINEIKLISYQIIKGISHLHSNNICHRDINPSNILVSSFNNIIIRKMKIKITCCYYFPI